MVNGEDIFRQHYKNVIHFHGEHRLDRKAIEEVLIPRIRKILNEAIPYCNENEIRVRFDEFLKIKETFPLGRYSVVWDDSRSSGNGDNNKTD